MLTKTSSPWKIPPCTREQLEKGRDSANKPLAIKEIMKGKFFAEKGKQFKGAHLMVDMDVIDKISERDPNAQFEIPETRLISNYFQPSE